MCVRINISGLSAQAHAAHHEHLYRVTRPAMYQDESCIGHKDLSAREGHYVRACCPLAAALKVAEKFPDTGSSITRESLDVQENW